MNEKIVAGWTWNNYHNTRVIAIHVPQRRYRVLLTTKQFQLVKDFVRPQQIPLMSEELYKKFVQQLRGQKLLRHFSRKRK